MYNPLPCCKQRAEEQRCCRTASNSVRMATDVLEDSENESAESMLQKEENYKKANYKMMQKKGKIRKV